MNQGPQTAKKGPAPAPARPLAPGAAPARAKADGPKLVLTRLSFAAPVFGMGEYSWSFMCEAAMAEDIQQALLERRPVKLEFPKNTVVLDASQVVLADFQPQG